MTIPADVTTLVTTLNRPLTQSQFRCLRGPLPDCFGAREFECYGELPNGLRLALDHMGIIACFGNRPEAHERRWADEEQQTRQGWPLSQQPMAVLMVRKEVGDCIAAVLDTASLVTLYDLLTPRMEYLRATLPGLREGRKAEFEAIEPEEKPQ